MPGRDRLPARLVPLLYLGAAHVSLALACLLVGWSPRAVAGFYYHSWMLAIVHLVTIGWITFSILGTIYVVAPVALRMPLPPRRADYVAFALALVGVIGMVAHFWIQEYGGMAWSAGTIAAALAYMTVRFVIAIRSAAIERTVKLHIALACVNFWIAASMGLLLAIDKVVHFLPGFVLSNVFAHAHLAALGWATMMVVGVAYRMLPMVLPAKMPKGRSVYASAMLLEIGVIGLFAALLGRSAWSIVFGIIIVAGLGVFGGHVIWMWRHRVSKPKDAPRLDFALLHAGAAGVSLIAAAIIGLLLLIRPPSVAMLHAAAAYGVLGLVGFLSQMVVAMEVRLLPLAVWLWAYSGSDYQTPPASPYAMRDTMLQAIVFGAWMLGVPSLAIGMALESSGLVAVGGWTLTAGVLGGLIDNAFVITHLFGAAASRTRAAMCAARR